MAAPDHSVRRLLLVDDHAIVREGVKRLLEPLAAEWAVAEAASGFEALDCLRRLPFELAIVDMSMPGMNGLDLIRRLKAEAPTMAVLVLSMHAEEQYAMRAFKAGANGYLTKDSAPGELLAAVTRVGSGGSYISAAVAERMIHQLNGQAGTPTLARLSDRELDVLRRIVAGERMTDIARALHLSVKTVSTHKARIQDKLQLSNTAELIRYGLENRLATDDSAFGELDPPLRGAR